MLCIDYGPRPRYAVCLGCDMALGPFVLYTFGYDNVSRPPRALSFELLYGLYLVSCSTYVIWPEAPVGPRPLC